MYSFWKWQFALFDIWYLTVRGESLRAVGFASDSEISDVKQCKLSFSKWIHLICYAKLFQKLVPILKSLWMTFLHCIIELLEWLFRKTCNSSTGWSFVRTQLCNQFMHSTSLYNVIFSFLKAFVKSFTHWSIITQ